jgi:DNA-binding SARP family transcriptional activator
VVRSATLVVCVWCASGVELAKPPSGTIHVSLTGDMSVRVGDAVVSSTAFPGRQGRLMFAYLAAHHRPVPRDELADILWPAGPPPHWRRDLSGLASRLRALLTRVGVPGSTALVGAGDWYELRLPDAVDVDVDVAAARLRDAIDALAAGDPHRALGAARAATAISRHLFLPGEDGAWIEAQQSALLRTLLGALDVSATAFERFGDISSAVDAAREAVELAPLAERGYARLMRLQLIAGDRADALRTFHRARELLARELGVEPGPAVQAAYLEVLRSTLGSADGTPPIENGPALGRLRGALPVPVDRFVGRHRELEAVAAALGSARLVTLCGVGGVGKSRLALEAALRLAPPYPEGAWQCELSPVAAGRDVAHSVATDLSVVQGPGCRWRRA